MDNDKQITAAITAVMSYLETEKTKRPPQLSKRYAVGAWNRTAAFAATVPVWGISGRLAQMQMRERLQRKAFNRLKLTNTFHITKSGIVT